MLLILCIVSVLVQADNIFEDDALTYEQAMQMEDRLSANKVRCTRRFTPGACLDKVTSVWTFNFQIQNCTERLGCPPSDRTNRFKNYSACIRLCHSLIELYEQILTFEGKNNSLQILRKGIPIRRKGSDYLTSTPMEEDYVAESSGDETINARLVYGENEPAEYDYTVQWN